MSLRPCWVCRQPVPMGRCPAHPTTDRVYRPHRDRRAVNGSAYATLRRAVLDRDDWVCQYCHHTASTVDHVLPRARGGRSVAENLVACCALCNNSKKDKTLQEWIATGCAPQGAIALLEAMQ